MTFVSDPLHGLARTARNIGFLTAGSSLVPLYMAATSNELLLPLVERWVYVLYSFLLLTLPGILMVVFALLVTRGYLWAAVGLVVLSVVNAVTLILSRLLVAALQPSGACCGMILHSILCAALLVRCGMAVPEIRYQFRARRRRYSAPGFQPVVAAPPATPRPPPASLKRSVPPRVPPRDPV
jgi:hypothetical protein